MDAYRGLWKEGVPMVHSWYTGHMVDRFTN